MARDIVKFAFITQQQQVYIEEVKERGKQSQVRKMRLIQRYSLI